MKEQKREGQRGEGAGEKEGKTRREKAEREKEVHDGVKLAG